MAMPIMSTRRRVQLVCAIEDDPKPSEASEMYRWRERQSGDVDRVVATARALSHLELAGLSTTAKGLVEATTLGVVSVDWPGGPATKDEALDALPFAARVSLGSWIYEASALPPDPTVPPAS